MRNLRKTILLTTLSALLAGAGVAGTLGGERESGESEHVANPADCSGFAWPRIPAPCLADGEPDQVRVVNVDRSDETSTMKQRFAAAFEDAPAVAVASQ